ncbi:porin [Burkholderia stagnalis]
MSAGVLVFPMMVAAQGSVTLYGSLSAGVQFVSNVAGRPQWAMSQGYTQPDRWGLYGTEDLGAGDKALFRLENGFSTISGMQTVGNAVFNRQAYVGLSSPRLGTLTLGHMAPFSFEWLGPMSTMYLAPSWALNHPGNIDELADTSAAVLNNAVRYVSPEWFGLVLGATFAFSNSTNFQSGREYGFGAKFKRGIASIVATYSKRTAQTLNLFPSLGLYRFQGVDLATSAYTADSVDNFGIGTVLDFGKIAAHALYTNVNLRRGASSSRYRSYEIGATYRTSPFNSIGGGFITTALDAAKWIQLGVTDTYALSKRTQIYAGVAYEQAGGGAAAALNGIGMSSVGRQVVLTSGIHHAF